MDLYENYKKIVKKQREYFQTGKTLNLEFRMNALKKLKKAILEFENRGKEALKKDLNKSEFESYMGEFGGVLIEIDFHLKNLKKWTKVRKVKTPLFLKPSYSRIMYEPYGVSLILSPWNYPFQLAIMPIIGAISAGNTVILKPSELAKNISSLLSELISSVFDEEYITVIEGGVEETTELLKQRFDFIFFTGSTKVGKIIASVAANNLTPCVLELGGKSPVILDENIPMDVSVRRLLMGKIMNCGQTCVAPDYVFLPTNRKNDFLDSFKKVMNEFFPNTDLAKAETYKSMTRIINENNFERIKSLLKNEKILSGGDCFEENLKFSPTLIDSGNVKNFLSGEIEKTNILKEEIFAPFLPIITYEDINDVIKYINLGEKPLALYLFSNDKNLRTRVLKTISFGGGCINDTITHLANENLPFGGVGNSGQGSYHGYASFLAFSHSKSLLYSSTKFDFSFKYMPYTEKKLKFLKIFFK